jgi:fructokinase
MSERRFNIVGLGEVLFDIFAPDKKMLGGAPANFAYVATKLGDRGMVASRVGDDSVGVEIIESLQASGVDVSLIQTDDSHASGTVLISLNGGQPEYKITANAAWDNLELNDAWRDAAATCDAVCFGTLAQRGEVSRIAITDFVAATREDALRIFDVNLRQEFYSADIVLQSLQLANVVKLNSDELPVVAELLEIPGTREFDVVKMLREKFDLRLACVTRGGSGSLLVTASEKSDHAGIEVEIADTVGAGDAFTAGMTHGLLRGHGLDEINERANRVGAFVASQVGAMPDFIDKIRDQKLNEF